MANEQKQFDVKMIKDFLTLLDLELRIANWDHTRSSEPPQEVTDNMIILQLMYSIPGLLPLISVVDDVGDPALLHEARGLSHQEGLDKASRSIGCLEYLSCIIGDALKLVAAYYRGESVHIQRVNASEILARNKDR